MTKEQIIAIATFCFGGVCFLSLGLILSVPVLVSWQFRRTAVRSLGTVIGYDTYERTESPTLYHPHIRYTDAQGSEHTTTVRGTDRKPFEPGEQVEILYRPDSPGQVEIAGLDGYGEMRFAGFWSMVAGLGCVVMGVVIWVFRIPVKAG